MYRRIKKILIVPLLIVTLMSCIIYTDYRKPVQVEAAVMTGDPFLDAFSWALELIGFNASKDKQEEASRSFFNQVRKNIHLLSEYTNSQFDESIIKKSDSWKKEMAKKWDKMSVRQRYIECANSYTEAEYRQSGSSQDYMSWVYDNYCQCESNPFANVTETVIPLNECIAMLIESEKITSAYTPEQWRTSGTLGILTMAVKDWVTYISQEIYEDANKIYTLALGTATVIGAAAMENFAWYQYLKNIDFQSYIDTSGGTFLMTDPVPTMNAARSAFLENLPKTYAFNLANLGSKYILDVNMYEYNDAEQRMSIKFIDIPDDTVKIKYSKTDNGWRGNYYSYECYDVSGNVLSSENSFITLFTYYKDTSKDWSMDYSVSGKYGAWDPFNFKYQHYVYNSSFGSVDNMDLMIPFGLSDVDVDTEGYVYTPPASCVIGTDSQDEDDYVPGTIVKTGNGTLADKVAGTVIDLDDVNYDAIPHDEVIDPALTDEKVAAREEENDKALTESLTRAEEREKDEAKEDAKPDAGTDTKDEDLDKYKIKVTDIFPFCIPFDIYRFFSCLAADPVAPSFTIPLIVENSFGIPEYSVEIDFSKFDSVAAILRKIELLGFCVGLAFVTNKLIKH